MFGKHVLHAMDSETLTLGIGKECLPAAPLWFFQPSLQNRDCRLRQWCAAFLAALSDHSDMSAGSQHYVLPLEARHFRKAQSGLSGHEDKRVIPAAQPGLPIGRREQRVYFGARQETHKGAGAGFTRNGQYALD